MKKITIILASEVKNLELAHRIQDFLKKKGCEGEMINLLDLELPLFTPRAEARHAPAELLKDVLPILEKSRGFVFIAPEYNGGIPPVLTNFLAWVSRSTKDWRLHLNGKGAALATYSGGAGFNVLLSMRTQLSYIGLNVVGRALQFSSKAEIDDGAIEAVLTQLHRIAPDA